MIIAEKDILFLIDKDKNEYYYKLTYELNEELNIHFLRVKRSDDPSYNVIQYYDPSTQLHWASATEAFNYIEQGIQFIDLSLIDTTGEVL